jgi:hypothetical protein
VAAFVLAVPLVREARLAPGGPTELVGLPPRFTLPRLLVGDAGGVWAVDALSGFRINIDGGIRRIEWPDSPLDRDKLLSVAVSGERLLIGVPDGRAILVGGAKAVFVDAPLIRAEKPSGKEEVAFVDGAPRRLELDRWLDDVADRPPARRHSVALDGYGIPQVACVVSGGGLELQADEITHVVCGDRMLAARARDGRIEVRTGSKKPWTTVATWPGFGPSVVAVGDRWMLLLARRDRAGMVLLDRDGQRLDHPAPATLAECLGDDGPFWIGFAKVLALFALAALIGARITVRWLRRAGRIVELSEWDADRLSTFATGWMLAISLMLLILAMPLLAHVQGVLWHG